MKPVFFINVKVYKESNLFFTDKANWLRLKLYLEPFDNVILICEATDKKGNDWIAIPPSIKCCVYKKSSLRFGQKVSTFIDFFKLFQFSFSSSLNASFIGILVSGPPFFHIGLFSSVIFRKKLLSIFIGSVSESYLFANGSHRSNNFILFLKEKISRYLEFLVIKKSQTLLSAGNTLDKYSFNKNKNRIKFSTSTIFSDQIDWNSSVRFSNLDKITWIYTGVLNKEKGVDRLLRSLKKIREFDKRHNVILIGKEDKNFDIRNYIIENKLQDSVTLTGQLSHEKVIEYLKEADVFVFLSLHEGMPKAPLEAMAVGLPVIVTATGAEYFVENRVNGIVLDSHDELEVIHCIIELATNDTFRNTIINNAKLTAVLQSYDYQVQKIHDFLIQTYPCLTSNTKKDWLI